MRVRKRVSLPLLIVAGLVAYALFQDPPEILQEVTPPADTAIAPDSYAHGVSMRSFDSNGKELDRTDARVLRRYDRTAVVELEQPRRFGHAGDSDWIADAQTGELRERNEVLLLRGNVRLRYVRESVEFNTQAMRFDLGKRTALSQAPVRVFQDDHETRADQLYLILDWQQARLSGDVKTVYVPEN